MNYFLHEIKFFYLHILMHIRERKTVWTNNVAKTRTILVFLSFPRMLEVVMSNYRRIIVIAKIRYNVEKDTELRIHE